MRRLLPLLLLPALMTSCADSNSAKQSKVQQEFQAAIKPLDAAQRGYVPGKDVKIDLLAYRQQQQNQAAKALESLLPDADPTMKVAIARVLADIHDSASRDQLSKAVTNWANLSNDASALLNGVIAIDRADGRMRSFSFDDTALLAKLNAARAQAQGPLADYQSQRQDWDAKIEHLTTKINTLQKQMQDTAGKAMEMRQQALTATGEQQYALYDQATQTAQQANVFDADLRKLNIQADLDSANVAIVRKQIEAAQANIASLDQQVKEVQDRQTKLQALAAEARTDKDNAIKSLQDALAAVAKGYAADVVGPFNDADAQSAKAVQTLTSAMSAAGGPAKRQVQMDLLAKEVSRLHLLTLESLAAADWYHKLNFIASAAAQKRGNETLMPQQQADLFQTAAQNAQGNLNDLTASVAKVSDDANRLATDLAGHGAAGDPIGAYAGTLGDQIKVYQQEVANLGSQQGAIAPPTTQTQPAATSTSPAGNM